MALVEQDMGKAPGALKKITDKLIEEYYETAEDLKNMTLEDNQTVKIPHNVFKKIKAHVE